MEDHDDGRDARLQMLAEAETTGVVGFVGQTLFVAGLAGGAAWLAVYWLLRLTGASNEIANAFGMGLGAFAALPTGWFYGKSMLDSNPFLGRHVAIVGALAIVAAIVVGIIVLASQNSG